MKRSDYPFPRERWRAERMSRSARVLPPQDLDMIGRLDSGTSLQKWRRGNCLQIYENKADPATLTRDYDVLPRSILESNNKTTAHVSDLKAKLDTCLPALYRKYEEVALATGTYNRFIDIARQRDANLRAPYAKRSTLLDEAARKFKPESMVDALRQSLTLDTDTPEGRAAMKGKVHAVGEPVADLYMQLTQSEQVILKI